MSYVWQRTNLISAEGASVDIDSGVRKAWKHPRLSSFFLSSLPHAFTVALERGVNGESFSVVENVVDRFVRKSFQRIIHFRRTKLSVDTKVCYRSDFRTST